MTTIVWLIYLPLYILWLVKKKPYKQKRRPKIGRPDHSEVIDQW
jgi:hypothetical protein